jgi:hypothetical protein
MSQTLEWLLLIAAANKQQRAELVLSLSQSLRAGMAAADPDAWLDKQQQLIDAIAG